MIVYTAGPISGLGYDEVVNRYKIRAKILQNMGYEILCPMTGKDYLRNELEFRASGYAHPASTNHAIIERDRWMVGKSDIIHVDLTNAPEKASIGSCMELAWAYELRKHTLIIMQEENTHRHAFVLEAADIVFTTVEESYDYLEKFIKGIV